MAGGSRRGFTPRASFVRVTEPEAAVRHAVLVEVFDNCDAEGIGDERTEIVAASWAAAQ